MLGKGMDPNAMMGKDPSMMGKDPSAGKDPSQPYDPLGGKDPALFQGKDPLTLMGVMVGKDQDTMGMTIKGFGKDPNMIGEDPSIINETIWSYKH
jgi:hypothetical protein